jgi:hypothetical protein
MGMLSEEYSRGQDGLVAAPEAVGRQEYWLRRS